MEDSSPSENVEPDVNAESGKKSPPPIPGPKEKDEKMWAMFCHLAAFACYLVPIPMASILGPLVVWSIYKDQYPLVMDQGKESVNFQLSLLIYFIIAILLCFVVIGFFLLPVLFLFQFICVVLATVKAGEGEKYRYPLCIRFIS